MDGIHHRRTRRRGFHPLGALAASIVGSALGLGVTTVLPSAAGASAPAAITTSVSTTAIPAPSTTTAAPRPTSTSAARPRITATTAAAPKKKALGTTTTAAPSSSARQAAALPAPPAPDPAGNHFAFLALDQGRPVRYDPCQPI